MVFGSHVVQCKNITSRLQPGIKKKAWHSQDSLQNCYFRYGNGFRGDEHL